MRPLTTPASARLPRALAWSARVRGAVRRHPLVVDAIMVAGIVLISLPHGLHDGQAQGGVFWGFMLGLVLPLAWRRKAPGPVFLTVALVALAQWSVHLLLPGDLALLIAFYTVAAYESWQRIVAAAAVLEIGAVLAATRFAPPGAAGWTWVFISGMVTAAGVIGYYVRTRRAYLAALEDRADRLERERDQQTELAASAERARIAREMHDIVAHHIAVMIALADGAAYTTHRDPDQATTIMGEVSQTGRTALAEMRRLLGVMRAPSQHVDNAPQPTIDDLEKLIDKVRTAGLPVRLRVTGAARPLPSSAQLVIYRLVQESLTNTLKHAKATSAQVTISYLADRVELDVTDDGTAAGLPADAHNASSPGHGIDGMRERAAVFGGDVGAGPKPDGGWRVHTSLQIVEAPITATQWPPAADPALAP